MSPSLRTLAASLTLALAVTAGTGPTAHADEHAVPGTTGATTVTGAVEAPRPAFYEPPAEIPATPGTLIRQERADTVLDPLDVASASFDARRIMYSSLDRDGVPVAVTGIVIAPKAPWVGVTRRPMVSFAAGTQGMADRCAPSRAMAQVSEYELIAMSNLLTRGYTVVVTDYQGLGTPGTHTYMDRVDQGHAVLDAARAAARAGLADTTPASPVGVQGYSQGGGAAAAAAELAPTYAPEIPLKGAAVGAVPADLVPVGKNLDGGLNAAFELYATAGLLAAHHIEPRTLLSETGLAKLRAVENECVFELFGSSFLKTSTLTDDGRSISDHFAEEPFTTALAANRIGDLAPKVPVLMVHSTLDDTIPYAVGVQLNKDWCAKGVNVSFRPSLVATHFGGLLPFNSQTLAFWEGRFAGVPQLSTCPVWR